MGISLITKGFLTKQAPGSITRIIYPLTLTITKKAPTLSLTVAKKVAIVCVKKEECK